MSTVNGEKATMKCCQEAPVQYHSKCEGYCVWSPYPEGHRTFIPQTVCLRRAWQHAETDMGTLCGLKPFWALLFLSAKWRSWDTICKDFSSQPHMWWILNTSYLSTSLIISSFLSDKNSVIKENSTYRKQQMPSLGVMERIGLFWMACSALV